MCIIAAVEETRGEAGEGDCLISRFDWQTLCYLLYIYINIMYTNVRSFVCVARYLVRKTNIRDGNDESRNNFQRGYRGYGLVFSLTLPPLRFVWFLPCTAPWSSISSARRARRRVYRNLTYYIDSL